MCYDERGGSNTCAHCRAPGGRIFESGTIAFGLFFMCWTGVIVNIGTRHGFDVVAALFVAIGVAALVGILLLAPWDRITQRYAVTDRRVLFIHRRPFQKVDAYTLAGMTPDNVRLLAPGKIGFADFAQRCGYNNDKWCMPEFDGIVDAPAVAELIRNAVAAARARRGW